MNHVATHDSYSYIIVLDGRSMLEVPAYCVAETCAGISVTIDYDIIVVTVLVREETLCLGSVPNSTFGAETLMARENYETYTAGSNTDTIYLSTREPSV